MSAALVPPVGPHDHTIGPADACLNPAPPPTFSTLLRRVAGKGASGRELFRTLDPTAVPARGGGKVAGGFHCLTGPAGRAAGPSYEPRSVA